MLRWCWARIEDSWSWMSRRAGRKSRQLRTEAIELSMGLAGSLSQLGEDAHKLRDDALTIARDVWLHIDALPFIPDLLEIPPVRRQLYGHGAFMGAAPALLADDRWRRILAFLMPDVYHDVSQAVTDGAGPGRLIPMFENNPVMCAFGIWRTITGQTRAESGPAWEFDLIGVEWDLFLDGDLLRQHSQAPSEERDGIIEKLLRSAVIAHASTTDTVQEALGFCQYADVRRTRKARLGGLEIPAWLDLFARALQLAGEEDPTARYLEMAALPRVLVGDACQLHTFSQPMTVAEAVDVFRGVSGREDFSVVLEIKSLQSTPELLSDLVAALNRYGLHVAAACSFHRAEVAGLSARPQHIGDRTLPGPREVQFFHFAGDLQRACDAGEIEAGQSVLFNGASLLELAAPDSESLYQVKEAVVAELADYRTRHQLHIGLYVQEGDCDSAAAALLSALVERHDDPFDLGFAWGGLREEVALQPSAERPRMGYGSQRNLALVGQARHWQISDGED
ncbi:MAG: hypothetical protein ACI8S6_001071 [Myxococcota bacterium]|jgi:hypothetical protein